MGSLSIGVVIPHSVRKVRKDLGLHFAFFHFIVACLVATVGRAVGENIRRKGKILAVAGYDKPGHTCRNGTYFRCFSTADGDGIDLRLAVTRRYKCDRLAVGEPSGCIVCFGTVRQLSRATAVDRNKPDVAVPFVGFFAVRRDCVGNPFSVR